MRSPVIVVDCRPAAASLGREKFSGPMRGGFGLPRKRLVPAGRIRSGPAYGLQGRLFTLTSIIHYLKNIKEVSSYSLVG
jgi:hypothetical protein